MEPLDGSHVKAGHAISKIFCFLAVACGWVRGGSHGNPRCLVVIQRPAFRSSSGQGKVSLSLNMSPLT